MKFVFVSWQGEMVPLGTRVSLEGHSSVMYAYNDVATFSTNGADIYVVDNPQMGDIADSVRQAGSKTLFSSKWSSLLDSSSSYNTGVIKGLGLKLSQGVKGKEFVIEGWFNGDKFISKTLSKMYYKLFAGDIGPAVNCTGVVTYGKLGGEDRIYKETLGMIEKPLRKVDYKGPVSLDIDIVDKEVYVSKIYAYPRDGLLESTLAGTKTPVGEIILKLSSGDRIDLTLDTWMASVMLTVPPYPYGEYAGESLSMSIKGLGEMNNKHFWLYNDVSTGRIGYVTARGKSPRESCRRVYRTISMVSLPEIQYRVDIGNGIEQEFLALAQNGLCQKIQVGG